MGDAALLLETDDIDAVLAVAAVLAPLAEAGEGVWADVDDLVPGARTLLVVARPTTDLDELGRVVLAAASGAIARTASTEQRVVEIRGPLRRARPRGGRPAHRPSARRGRRGPHRARCGGRASVASRRASPTSSAGTAGCVVARRGEPRTRVPAGSVGLAGEFSGVYPRESPGGWQLIGTTDAVLWDADRQPPALLAPGMTVQFTEVAR